MAGLPYSKIPDTTFEEIQLGAGVLVRNFVPDTATVNPADIIGATSGGVSFSAVPSYVDFGEDIDNCPTRMKELMQLENWDITMSGSFVTVNPAMVASLIGPASVEETKVTARNAILDEDFADIWWVGDYSSAGSNGFIAIHMMNALSTGGFSLQSTSKGKGAFDFEFAAHFSMEAQDAVPFEIYVQKGNE